MRHQTRRPMGPGRWRRAWRNALRRAIRGDAGAAPPDPDDDVLHLVADGALSCALTQLMRRHGTAVYRYCREALHDATLADDVHQQVFIEAFRDLGGFARRSTLRVWLFAIARHRVLDAAKKRRRRRDSGDELEAAEPVDPQPLPGERLDDERLRRALIATMGELDERLRTALLLRYQQGFTFEDIAEVCREKSGTIRARIVRALPMVRARIEARLRAPAPTDTQDRAA
ncbi:MAG: sigma-70 family RNA polymerase sigma factor [Deltaproteobacteria bacterium]|nr:MAG: sigma-70 family RNA polymerase sigma factor [Deltaproteobacteria bacterium]TMQ13783.1 MAG: sigma-70 family RNA polymerase sigma factor [Deltaproteobacteria bacterium]